MKISVIDIGTNTVLMLICSLDFEAKSLIRVAESFNIPRIGKQLQATGKIGNEEIEKLIGVLKEYKMLSDREQVTQIYALATHAFRVAANAQEVIDTVDKATGIKITTISPVDEGSLSFLGAVSGFGEYTSFSVIDIGGGSTEISYGTTQGLEQTQSKQIGVVTLNDKFLSSGEHSLQNFAAVEFNKVFSDFYNQKGQAVIALAGTPTTLACIKEGLTEYDETTVEGSYLHADEIQQFIDEIDPLTSDEIAVKYKAVVAGREDLIKAGAVLLLASMKLLKTETVIVSTKGLRYGAAIQLLSTLKQ